MKILAAILFAITLPATFVAPSPRPLVTAKQQKVARKGGTWYFAETGHAVYCFGPVRYIQDVQGQLTRVATFCQGDQVIVPLKD